MKFAALRFDCHGCGRCCRTEWDIPVEQPDFPAQRLADGRYLLIRQDGCCTQLDPEGGCRLHGTPAKPRACRLFPFQLVATPAGVEVGVSFYCPSVYHGRGRLLQDHQPELEGLFEPPAMLATGPIALNENETLGWSGYTLLEEALQQIVPHLWGSVRELGHLAGRSLEELTPVWIPGQPFADEPLLRRYMGHLLERRYLLTGPGRNLRENLGLLALIPYLLHEPAEVSVAVLERDFYTHGRGAAAWLPGLRAWLESM